MLDPKVAIDRINAVMGRHPGHRALHAKGAFFSGTFTASPEATKLSRAAHLNGDAIPVIVRWSSGSGNPRISDAKPDVRGMAISFRVPGAVINMPAQTAPRFVVRTPEGFVDFVEASAKPWKVGPFLLKHKGAAAALVANVKGHALSKKSFAENTYYPVHSQGWRDADDNLTWVRFRLVPLGSTAPAEKPEGKNWLFDDINARVAAGPVRFDLRATVAGPDDDHDDPMSQWKGADEFSAGVIEVTGLDSTEANGSGIFVFDPTREADGIELPDDPILKYRAVAYSESAARRSS